MYKTGSTTSVNYLLCIDTIYYCQGSHFSGLTKFPDFSLTFPVFFPIFQYFFSVLFSLLKT